MIRYRRGELEGWQELSAAAAALLAGAATFYLARLWLGREALPAPTGGEGDERRESRQAERRPARSEAAARRGAEPR